MSDVEIGQVVKVKDWPGTGTDRFVVTGFRESPVYGRTVEAFRIDKNQGSLVFTARRFFPLANCTVDTRATKQHERHIKRVTERLTNTRRKNGRTSSTKKRKG